VFLVKTYHVLNDAHRPHTSHFAGDIASEKGTVDKSELGGDADFFDVRFVDRDSSIRELEKSNRKRSV
jgi:hypothetical protein